jgi:hypothetical protein
MVVFPAYALLVGLGFAKAQSVVRAGPLVAAGLGALLLCVIGAKLVRYYHAPASHKTQHTAEALHNSVANGDAVVFTGLRGLPTIYYLSRAGYRWRDGYCEDPAQERRFACRMFPLETEQAPSIYEARRVKASLDAVNEDLTVFLQGLQGPENRLWVVFNQVDLSNAGLEVPEPDSFLVGQLARRGLRPLPLDAHGGLDIFRFVPE